MKTINKQIKELEREIDDIIKDLMSYGYSEEEMINDLKDKNIWDSDTTEEVKLNYIKLQAKLQTLKECKKMFEDYNEKLNNYFGNDLVFPCCAVENYDKIKELSKEVMGE